MKRLLYRQFGNPDGPIGALAGLIMARRTSNRRRNRWTVEQLEIKPTDQVLEIGFGPGVGIGYAADRAHLGRVVGVDHSAVMRRQARRRNRDAVAAGRVELVVGQSADLLTSYPGSFDKAFAVNVFPFWSDAVGVLRQIAQLLVPGGRIALTIQPRGRGTTNDHTRLAGARLREALLDAGFAGVEVRTLRLRPVDAVCALATLPTNQPTKVGGS